jgi:hypothetical protein
VTRVTVCGTYEPLLRRPGERIEDSPIRGEPEVRREAEAIVIELAKAIAKRLESDVSSGC